MSDGATTTRPARISWRKRQDARTPVSIDPHRTSGRPSPSA